MKARLSKTIFGALNMRTSRFYWKQADTGNSQQLLLFLHQLHKANPNKKLMIVLDNGPIHKSKKVQKFVQKNDWVHLLFLPAYSPEYNPIERFWQWLKQRVYGCKSFSTMEELLQKIRKLVWHFHEGRTVSTINFNYDAYADLL
ncbi:transposase IS630 family transporter [Legionella santicrucis]|uniref:Transposase IS630 family transporter n=1 Tax=Legionella santicrucis TaxID=45074 RepID=A0A0W0Z346_9GAMM|nr:IS630 family transposase [Legionella santicrucis]KTD63279.1 transposase IS630 family transporter [Legionella santicrucis]HAU3583342.1 IS630 family transposase [Legionella pneumophila]